MHHNRWHRTTAYLQINILLLLLFNVNKKVQLNTTVCRHLFTAQSLYMFRVSQHPSSGVLKTVFATSGVGHDAGTAASFHRGLIRPRWKEAAVPASWPIPEVADTVFSTPDDGYCDTRNMWSDCAVNKCLHTVASSWTFLLTLNHDARNHEFKILLLLLLLLLLLYIVRISLYV